MKTQSIINLIIRSIKTIKQYRIFTEKPFKSLKIMYFILYNFEIK